MFEALRLAVQSILGAGLFAVLVLVFLFCVIGEIVTKLALKRRVFKWLRRLGLMAPAKRPDKLAKENDAPPFV